MMKLSDYVFRFVSEQLGVKTVFMLTGGGAMHLNDSVGKYKREGKLDYVCCLHEQPVAIATEAYSQYTNNFGVGLVTTGPGGTNAITGVAAAWIDSVPCMFISGQVKRKDLMTARGVRQMGNQEVDIVSMVAPITKYAVTVLEPNEIRYHLEKAAHLARTRRPGPVWLDIPLDVQAATIDETKLIGFDDFEKPFRFDKKLLQKQVSETIALLNSSERPALLVGNGVRFAKAEKDLMKLAETLGIPVLTTWRTADMFPEDHPLYFGRPGSIASRYANFTQQNSDLLLAIGARLDLPQTAFTHENLAPKAKKVIVDVDANEIKKLGFKIDVPACFDAKAFMTELLKQLPALKKQDRSKWLSACRKWKEKYPIVLPEHTKKEKFVSTYALVDMLSEYLGENDLVIPSSSGASSEIVQQAFRIKKGQRLFCSPGLGAMGFGLSEAIGGCVASGRRTILVEGDGGFQLNIQELETVKRLNLPIKMFVLSNNAYGSIRNTQNNYFEGRLTGCDFSSGVTIPDMVAVAQAYGIKANRVTTNKELRAKLNQILDSDGPFLCDVLVDPTEPTMPRTKSEVRPDGSIVTKPMEDLWPFLERKEFESNILTRE